MAFPGLGRRVEVLVLVDQTRTNRADARPQVCENRVTLTREQVDGEWLVADLET